jgi:hypothetical protein
MCASNWSFCSRSRRPTPLEDVVSERFVIDRLDDLLSHFNGALEDWRDILQGHWKMNQHWF